eukprot:gene9354-11874_t
MTNSPRSRAPRRLSLIMVLLTLAAPGFAATESLLGRWALTLGNGRAGWLEIRQEAGWLDGHILWGGGSVLPVASVAIVDDTLTVTRVREISRKNAAGVEVRKQQATETISGRLEDGVLKLTRTGFNAAGTAMERETLTGRRIPALPPAPDLGKVKFGAPVALFN